MIDFVRTILVDIVKQICQHLRSRLQPLCNKFADPILCTRDDLNQLQELIDFAKERFDYHWHCCQTFTDNIGLELNVDNIDDPAIYAEILFLLGNCGSLAAGCVVLDDHEIILSEGIVEGRVSIIDILQWSGDRADHFDMEYVALISSCKVSSYLQPVELSSLEEFVVRDFIQKLPFRKNQLRIISLSSYVIKTFFNDIKSHVKTVDSFPVSTSPNPELRKVLNNILLEISDINTVIGELVSAAPVCLLNGYDKSRWHAICSLAVETGLRLETTRQAINDDQCRQILINTINVISRWLKILVPYSDEVTPDSLLWGLSGLESLMQFVHSYIFQTYSTSNIEQLLNECLRDILPIFHKLHLYLANSPKKSGQLQQSILRLKFINQKLAELSQKFPNIQNSLIEVSTKSSLSNFFHAHSNRNLMPWSIGLINHGYEIFECVGSGSTSSVYKAVAVKTGGVVAIKVNYLQNSFKSTKGSKFSTTTTHFDEIMMEKEARVLLTIHHPNIVTFWKIFKSDGYTFLVMEFCEGGTLMDFFIKGNHFGNLRIVQHCIRDIIRGLMFLHMRNMSHGDLKPENILISQPVSSSAVPNAKLADFGLSRLCQSLKMNNKGFKKNRYIGTVPYMAPEIFRGKKPSVESDIWSFGCILHYLVTGRHPWSQITNESALIFAVGSGRCIEYLRSVGNDELDRILRACLQVDPVNRPSILQLLTSNFLNP